MKSLLDLWKPRNKFLLYLKNTLMLLCFVSYLMFLVLPFLGKIEQTQSVFKWLWVGVAIVNLDKLLEYKNCHKNRTIALFFTVFCMLFVIYLYEYWGLLNVAYVVMIPIMIGVWELVITIAINKCVKFTDRMKEITLNEADIKLFALGALYITSILLFVLGQIVCDKILFYVFGGIVVVILATSILIGISYLLFDKRRAISNILFIVDIVSLLGMLIYLIFTIDNSELRTIILTITSSVIGGTLTLAGVAWTIRKADIDRKKDLEQRDKEKQEEERKRFKPIFNVFLTQPQIGALAYIDESYFPTTDGFSPYNKTDDCKVWSEIRPILIRNLDFSAFYIYGFKINDKIIKLSGYRCVDKSMYAHIDFPRVFFTPEKINYLGILVIDLLDNVYEVQLKMQTQEQTHNPVDFVEYESPHYYYAVMRNGRAELTDIKVDI